MFKKKNKPYTKYRSVKVSSFSLFGGPSEMDRKKEEMLNSGWYLVSQTPEGKRHYLLEFAYEMSPEEIEAEKKKQTGCLQVIAAVAMIGVFVALFTGGDDPSDSETLRAANETPGTRVAELAESTALRSPTSSPTRILSPTANPPTPTDLVPIQPTAIDTAIPTSTPSLTTTPTIQPTRVSQSSATPTPRPPATPAASHTVLTNNANVLFHLGTIEFRNRALDRSPNEGVFIVIQGELENRSTRSECIYAQNVRLRLDSTDFSPDDGLMDNFKRLLGGRDFIGTYGGQCIDANSSSLTFVAFDAPFGAHDVRLSFFDDVVRINIPWPESTDSYVIGRRMDLRREVQQIAVLATRTPSHATVSTPTSRPVSLQPTATQHILYHATTAGNLRPCPRVSAECEPVASVGAGTELQIIGESQGSMVAGSTLWYVIERAGQQLYIHSSLVSGPVVTTPAPVTQSNAVPQESSSNFSCVSDIPLGYNVNPGRQTYSFTSTDFQNFGLMVLTGEPDYLDESFVLYAMDNEQLRIGLDFAIATDSRFAIIQNYANAYSLEACLRELTLTDERGNSVKKEVLTGFEKDLLNIYPDYSAIAFNFEHAGNAFRGEISDYAAIFGERAPDPALLLEILKEFVTFVVGAADNTSYSTGNTATSLQQPVRPTWTPESIEGSFEIDEIILLINLTLMSNGIPSRSADMRNDTLIFEISLTNDQMDNFADSLGHIIAAVTGSTVGSFETYASPSVALPRDIQINLYYGTVRVNSVHYKYSDAVAFIDGHMTVQQLFSRIHVR